MPADAKEAPAGPSAIGPDGSGSVRLLPDQPPGRSTRKALPFADEIRRLHAMGYTLEAIRQTLSAAGVSVSRSTVHREVSRRAVPASLPVEIKRAEAGAGIPALLKPGLTQAAKARDSSTSTNADNQLGKEGAEAFFKSHESNPLFPTKESS